MFDPAVVLHKKSFLMKKQHILVTAGIISMALMGCKKEGCTDPGALNFDSEAKKDNGSCAYYSEEEYDVPTTYSFTDANGNSTVNYSGQADRLQQLKEMVVMMKTGTTAALDAQTLKDMFANTGDNGAGNFSFSSTKQLKDKCFNLDQQMFENWMDSIAKASLSFSMTAADGQAGTLTSSEGKTYLFDDKGYEHVQLIEKGLMGAVFMYQALNVYFSDAKMDVDNTTPVDPAAGKYYTTMEHHFDEAFGYFGVEPSFPMLIPDSFWGKYCNSQNGTLNSNADMMNNFLRGRAAISADVLEDRDAAIIAIRKEWEDISANQAIKYLNDAVSAFGTDNAKFLHVLSEAYAFTWNLRYAPIETRRLSAAEHAAIMLFFKDNLWDMSVSDINSIKGALDSKY